MRTIHRTIVSALIFSKDGKLLMGMKDPKNGGVYADCWHIPGGGVDEGETKEQALRREMLEEVGIDIANCTVAQLHLPTTKVQAKPKKPSKISAKRFFARCSLTCIVLMSIKMRTKSKSN
jgi:8-oxo-dGTP pyrophosphatase MutT (NUDIX family)